MMSDHMVGTRPRIKMFTILAMCLGVMAIGASSASAAVPVTYNFTGVAHNAFVYMGGDGGTKCEKLTVTGQAVQPALPTETKTGTVSNLTSTNCINTLWNVPVTASLTAPWSLSFKPGAPGTVTNFNIHFAWTGAPEAIYCEVAGGPKVVSQTGWTWLRTDALTVKNSSGGAVGVGFCMNGPGYIEAAFAVTYTKVS